MIEWVSVDDRLPENRKKRYLLKSANGVYIGCLYDKYWSLEWVTGENISLLEDRVITHWASMDGLL